MATLSPLHMCPSVRPHAQIQQKRTSPAFKDVIDLPQQQSHVAELRLPGLAEHLQVLLGDLTGRVEGQRLRRRDDLDHSGKTCDLTGSKKYVSRTNF